MISKNSSALDLLEYEEKTKAERYILIGWCVLVLVMNLAGNSIILLSTIRYRAIRLDRVSVLLIKNIAVSDILLAVFAVHPTLVSLIWDKWPYGTFLCSMFASLGNLCAISGILLVCAMHISKLLSLLYPLHSIGRTTRSGHRISISIWLLSAVSPITNIIVDKQSFYFNYKTYKCCFSATAPIMKWLLPVKGFIFIIIPNLLVLCTTVALLSVVKKATGRF
ncbi:C-X-C chemokine receptor type 1-like [Bolinopsis microptera]|uniref:C-X-C chemokine receptor type 1-like n=1 Tax=Bolinopsis microptera TaxID=2820187 RepID=UPI003079706D